MDSNDKTFHLSDEELAKFTQLPHDEDRITYKNLMESGFYDPPESDESPTMSSLPRPPVSSVEMGNLRDCSEEFTFLKKLGQGGQGVVWEALQHHLGRTVAVKQALQEPELLHSFIKESLTAAQLDHPNIIPVYDLAVTTNEGEKVPILAMKRVVGRNWRKMLEEDRSSSAFSLDKFLMEHIPTLIDVTNAVAFAHSRGVIHRDLKPDQVMVGDFGEVYLLDWGLAVFVGDMEKVDARGVLPPSESYYTLDSATNPAGTPAYMAPEQTHIDNDHLGLHTDIYLLGATLFELLTGDPPHRSDSVRRALYAAEKNIYPLIPPDAPDDLARLARQCMETDPKDRPANALVIRHQLEDWLTGAGKRGESVRITEEIRAIRLDDLKDYTPLSELGRKLAQARLFWPANSEIPALRQALLARYAEVAIDKSDFLLAQLQTGRLEDAVRREELLRLIREKKDQFASNLNTPPLFTPLRISLFVGLLLIVAAALGGILHVTERSMMQEIHNQVRSMATLTAGEINPANLRAVDQHLGIETPEFQAVFTRMDTIRRANPMIRYVYTLRPADDGPRTLWRTIVDVDPYNVDLTGDGIIDIEGNPPGNDYPYGIDAMWEAWEGTEPTSAILRDRWGEFVSGFAPVRDRRTGEPVAIAAVDIELSEVMGRLHSLRGTIIVAGVLIFLLLTVVFVAWSMGRRALERIRLLQELLQRQEQEANRTDIHLG